MEIGVYSMVLTAIGIVFRYEEWIYFAPWSNYLLFCIPMRAHSLNWK